MFAASAVNAENVTDFRMCRNTNCKVTDVFIDPCPEALEEKPCELPQTVNASITFKYKPKFGSASPRTRLYAETVFLDLPFLDMDTNACLYTNCPIMKDTEQNWLYKLFVSKNYPKARYTVKLKFWDDGPTALETDQCCFRFNITIV
ncbi:hypothetical protein ACI65C_002418 [Semiaphis heraclei]